MNNPDFIDFRGNKFWFKNGEKIIQKKIILNGDDHQDDELFSSLHRDDDYPSVIKIDGTKKWYKNGKLDRDENLGPAIIFNDFQAYYKNGKKHRINGPAIIHSDGSCEWYKDSKLDRDENLGPAVITFDGSYFYYKNGQLYSEFNNTIFLSKNFRYFFFCTDSSICSDKFHLITKFLESIDYDIISILNQYDSSLSFWIQNDKLHRIGSPSIIIHSYGIEKWFENNIKVKSHYFETVKKLKKITPVLHKIIYNFLENPEKFLC